MIWIIYRLIICIAAAIAANSLIYDDLSSGATFGLWLLLIFLFERLYVSIRIQYG